jgi:hypothetical protein
VQGIHPQVKVHCLRPAGISVEQLLARSLQEVTNGLLGNAILEVRVYATKVSFVVSRGILAGRCCCGIACCCNGSAVS